MDAPEKTVSDSLQRTRVLQSYAILDTPPELQFDRLVELAAELCDAPIAAVSLLDETRQWFKASYGLDVREMDISISFCQHAIEQQGLYLIEDAARHPLFHDNPLVTGALGVRFYAGYPLITPSGHALGTLFVIDRRVRSLSDRQRRQFQTLADQTMVALELHRQRTELKLRLDQQANIHAILHQLAGDAAQVGYWQKRSSSLTIDWSAEALKILHIRPGEPSTVASLLQRMEPEDRQRWSEAFAHAMVAGKSMDVECSFRSGGQRVQLRWLGIARQDPLLAPEWEVYGVVQDVTRHREQEEAAQRIHERFRIAAELVSDALWDWDLQADSLWWSAGMHRLFGHEEVDDLPNYLGQALLHPEDRGPVLARVRTALSGTGDTWRDVYRLRKADGNYAWVENSAKIVRNGDGGAVRMVGLIRDITGAREQQARQADDARRLSEQAALLDKARDAIIVIDLEDRIRYWNAGATRLYGWTASEAIGQLQHELLREDAQEIRHRSGQLLLAEEMTLDLTQQHKEGRALQVHAHWTLVRDDAGHPQAIFSVNTDVTRQRSDEARIQQLAFYDTLTGLPNRANFIERLNHALQSSERHREYGAVMFLDLDNFKVLNDTLGHVVGDTLLQQVAQRLQRAMRRVDTVARLGGDEFVVLLEELGGELSRAAMQAEVAGRKVLAAFTEPYILDGEVRTFSASVGVTLFRGQAASPGELLKQADLAMYGAKQAGRQTMRFYNPQMQQAAHERARLETDLRQALAGHQFLLHYQPQFGRAGQLIGMEVLLRWQHPQRGLVLPDEFIGACEDNGLIVPLGRWVLEQACRQWAEWRETTGSATRLSVNITAKQLRHPDFVDEVFGILDAAGMDPNCLKLELTESALLLDVDRAIGKIQQLRARGVRFALDDFGTGFSSLALLRRLPIDQLKVDQSFVRHLESSHADQRVVQSIIDLGKHLDMMVLAEGVETPEQNRLLVDYGCDEFQGFLHARPLAAEDAAALL